MWYVLDTDFTIQGILSTITEMTIQHNFVEVDTMTFSLPYEDDVYQLVKKGRILYRLDDRNNRKGFIIHTIEAKENDNQIWGSAYGLESILDNRVINIPTSYNTHAETIMHNLINDHLISPSDANRKVDNLSIIADSGRGAIYDETYYGESVYEACQSLSQNSRVGFRVSMYPDTYDTESQFYQVETYVGTDRTTLQSEANPIIWKHEWNDTQEEVLLVSNKDSKNVAYLVSGDDTPITVKVGEESGVIKGWNRKEMYIQASDIRVTEATADTPAITASQVRGLLKKRGRSDLWSRRDTISYDFVLTDDIDEVYGVSYQEGDYVTIVNEMYGITEHIQIVTVEEKIYESMSQFTIKFDDNEGV